MKQDPKDKQNSAQDAADSAKSVLASYYDDLLGEIANDPLQKLNAQEMSGIAEAPTSPEKILPKKAKPETAKTEFAERQPANFMNPVVIPAAFPKFAPPEVKTDVKTEVKTNVETQIEESAPKVDSLTEQSETAKVKAQTVTEKQVEQKSVLVTPPKPRSVEDKPALQEQVIEEPEALQQNQPATDDLSETMADTTSLIEVREPEEWLSNGRPVWAQDRFECLLFSVAGLKLAVPLISLGAIYQIEKEFTPLVGRADWFMGLYRTQDRNVQVVDTAKWVMPDRYHEQVREGYHYIIRLGDNNWGIACDSVHEAIQLEPTQVKWRTERSKRPWLSGTVIDHMCALLDADMLGYLLHQDERLH